MSQKKKIKEILEQMHQNTDRLKNMVRDMYDLEDDKELLSRADSVLETISGLRDLNVKLMETLVNDVWLNKLQKVIADIPPGLISVEKNEAGEYMIYVNGKLYSEDLNYNEAHHQLTNLKHGYELAKTCWTRLHK